MRHRVRDGSSLASILRLTQAESAAFAGTGVAFPLAITPYYASLLDPDNPDQPLRRSVVPTIHETLRAQGELDDPLAEEADEPVPGLVHRYPDRVLLLATESCSVYCRYCTRSRLVGRGHAAGETHGEPVRYRRWEAALQYIAAHPEIRDVLVSGGDPLTLSDDSIEWLLSRIRAIGHVEIIRLGTKVPAVLPMRITPRLVSIIRRYHPVWMSLHVTHPDELTSDMGRACECLADAGIPLGSQTVLLSGVNDSVPVLKQLFQKLLTMRVRPYYLYQCDPIPGSAHFRTSVATGLEIIRGLRGHTTGYAVPNYVIDAPGGGGKIPLQPDYCVGRDDDELILENYQGRTFTYPDPKVHA
ncbi:MAG: KamA family radical SAM protein [Spirochaetaceae bacterium]|nr:MAG: KamA family radical SAM protein [Spirochaetaceae bacterium]